MLLDILISFIIVVPVFVLIYGITVAVVSVHKYTQNKLGKERYHNVVGRIISIVVVSVMLLMVTALVYAIVFT
ncbi:MAG: hypothetical protein L0I92_09070 [Staphylococcus equorum]|nr:hypothetical protein [Staphylococcus equorum]